MPIIRRVERAPVVRRVERAAAIPRVEITRLASATANQALSLEADVALPPADWPKFLDPWIEGLNVRPNPWSTSAAPTFFLDPAASLKFTGVTRDDVPHTPEDFYDRIVDRLTFNLAHGAHAEGMEAVYAANDALKKEAAARGKKADAAIGEFAAAGSILAGPGYGAAIEVAWAGFKALGNALYGPVDTPEDFQRLSDTYKATMQEGYPPPWGIFGGILTASAADLANVVQSALDKFRRLPADDRVAVRKAWALMILHAKDPAVEDMFNGLQWGDGAASEIQVFYLARTLAAANGLEERDLFVRLFKTAGDWRSRMDLLTSASSPAGGLKVDNAGVVQWATLARAAFALVDAEKDSAPMVVASGARIRDRELFAIEPSSEPSSEPQPKGLVGGSATGWLVGTTTLAALVGGLWYARRIGWKV